VIRLVKAEMRKLLSTQVWFWLLAGTLGLTALQVFLVVLNTKTERDLHDNVANIFSATGNGSIFVLVLGALAVTTEFRHQTITPTLLTTPRRFTVIWAKLITYALLGIAFAAACVVVTLAIALPWLTAKDIGFSLSADHAPRVMFAGFGVVALYALFGLGIGALLRNQAAAVVVGIIYVIILEPLIQLIPWVRMHIYPYLPGAGAAAMQAIDRHPTDYYTLLTPWAGALSLFIWCLVLSLGGTALTLRRDIT
jgi:ABC-2 type transport system permease protein